MDKVEKNQRGRKQNVQVTTNDLLVYIDQYVREHPNEKLKIARIAKYADIARHYFYDRDGIEDRIHEINNIRYEDYEISITNKSKELLELPDVDSLVENNYRNKTKLKEVISHYFNVIQQFYNSSCEKFQLEKECKKLKHENEGLKVEVSRQKEKKEHYKKLADHYEAQMKTMVIRSSETSYRKENNIKDIVLDFNSKKKAILSTDNEELTKMMNMMED